MNRCLLFATQGAVKSMSVEGCMFGFGPYVERLVNKTDNIQSIAKTKG
jgi:hypothetical protein